MLFLSYAIYHILLWMTVVPAVALALVPDCELLEDLDCELFIFLQMQVHSFEWKYDVHHYLLNEHMSERRSMATIQTQNIFFTTAYRPKLICKNLCAGRERSRSFPEAIHVRLHQGKLVPQYPHFAGIHPWSCSFPFPGSIIRLRVLTSLAIRCHHVTNLWPTEWEQSDVYSFPAWQIETYKAPSPISFSQRTFQKRWSWEQIGACIPI